MFAIREQIFIEETPVFYLLTDSLLTVKKVPPDRYFLSGETLFGRISSLQDAYALFRNVTIWALVQVLPEPNCVAFTPAVMLFFTAQRTAL